MFISTRSLFIFLHFVVRVCACETHVWRPQDDGESVVPSLLVLFPWSRVAPIPKLSSFSFVALPVNCLFLPLPPVLGLQHSHAGFVSLLHLGSKLRSLCLQNKHICPPGPLPNLHSFVKVDRSRSLVAILCGITVWWKVGNLHFPKILYCSPHSHSSYSNLWKIFL